MGTGVVVSTCMLKRIIKKVDAITRKPSEVIRGHQRSSDAITRKLIAVDASRVEASTSAWRSEVPPCATCEGNRRALGVVVSTRMRSEVPPCATCLPCWS